LLKDIERESETTKGCGLDFSYYVARKWNASDLITLRHVETSCLGIESAAWIRFKVFHTNILDFRE
jgi:hypothetical protein